MALLLFLVCAVIGAVVLTAATASAGRLSGLAEMDQRYYSVSSAAELLVNQLCDKTIKFSEISSETVTITEIYTSEGVKTGTETGTPHDTPTLYSINDGDPVSAVTENNSFLTQRAIDFIHNNAQNSGSFTLTHADAALNTVVDWSIDTDGKLILTIKSGADGEAYKLRLVLVPYVSEEKNTYSSDSAPTVTTTATGYNRIITTTTVETTVSTIKWTFGEIVKEVSQPDEVTTSNS